MDIKYNYLDGIFFMNDLDYFKDLVHIKPKVSVEDYITSQMHYDVVVNVNKRNIKVYNSAYNFIHGRCDNLMAYKTVLKYFYYDISTSLLNSRSIDKCEDFSILGDNKIPRQDELNVLYVDMDNVMKDIQEYIGGNSEVANTDIDIKTLVNPLSIRLYGFKNIRILTEALLMRYVADSDYDCFSYRR